MLIYEINAMEREEIMEALEWAMFGIHNAISDEENPGVTISLRDEHEKVSRLWDRLNQRHPIDSSF